MLLYTYPGISYCRVGDRTNIIDSGKRVMQPVLFSGHMRRWLQTRIADMIVSTVLPAGSPPYAIFIIGINTSSYMATYST